jgi:predicted nucleotidyltransferase
MMEQSNRAPSLEELRARREEILRILANWGARNVRVFGSVARSEGHATSDVDFIVEMDPERTMLDLSELILDLEDALERRVDIVEERPGSSIEDSILREAVPL